MKTSLERLGRSLGRTSHFREQEHNYLLVELKYIAINALLFFNCSNFMHTYKHNISKHH